MGQEWWDQQRKAAYAAANYCCQACGIPKAEAKYHPWLEAHELYEFDYPAGRMIFKEIVALCHACHNYIHSGRMSVLVDKGEMAAWKKHEILARGDRLLKAAQLKRQPAPKQVAPWRDWRLIFEGREYAGLFSHFEAWANHYKRYNRTNTP